MKIRLLGLTSRTPSLRFAMNQASSFPASVSTAMIAPSCTNCSSDFYHYDLLHTHGAEHFHRPLRDHGRAWMDRGPSMVLDDERGYAVVTEQQRGGHSDEAAPAISTGTSMSLMCRLLCIQAQPASAANQQKLSQLCPLATYPLFRCCCDFIPTQALPAW